MQAKQFNEEVQTVKTSSETLEKAKIFEGFDSKMTVAKAGPKMKSE